jgi:hypothetical protein
MIDLTGASLVAYLLRIIRDIVANVARTRDTARRSAKSPSKPLRQERQLT